MTTAEPSTAPGVALQDEPCVLLVNDDPGALFALRAVLSDLDATIVTAASGEQALMRLLKQDFFVILMDVKMPIIALTAKAMLEGRTKCLEAGASGYTPKPVTEQLLAQLCVWLGQPAAAPG